MGIDLTITGLASVIALAAPVLFAVIGETITERAGIINLSVNGTILLTAMAGFAAALTTQKHLRGLFGRGADWFFCGPDRCF
jgi:general nucleoside transport system permease protein